MLNRYIRPVVRLQSSQKRTPPGLTLSRRRCSASAAEDVDRVRTLLQLCQDRHYICPGQTNAELFQRGVSCSYGPLGMELRRNLLEQWWLSVTRSRVQVFGINTLNSCADGAGRFAVVETEHLKQILKKPELSKEQIIQEVQMLFQRSKYVRTNFLQGKRKQNTEKTLPRK